MELGLCEIVYVKNLSRFVPFSFKERIQKGQEVCDRIVSVRLILLNSIIVKWSACLRSRGVLAPGQPRTDVFYDFTALPDAVGHVVRARGCEFVACLLKTPVQVVAIESFGLLS